MALIYQLILFVYFPWIGGIFVKDDSFSTSFFRVMMARESKTSCYESKMSKMHIAASETTEHLDVGLTKGL